MIRSLYASISMRDAGNCLQVGLTLNISDALLQYLLERFRILQLLRNFANDVFR